MSVANEMRDLDELVQISLLSEYFYCKRRCGLILLEGHPGKNVYMVEGDIDHASVHTSKIDKRSNFARLYNLQIFSHKYALIGKADCIECEKNANGAYVDLLGDNYAIVPVEYKHGITRDENEYKIQLCAQAMCLEEMYNTKITRGYIYYTDSEERFEVEFTDALKQSVLSGVSAILKIIRSGELPDVKLKRGCSKCALSEKCNPKLNNIHKYIDEMWGELR